MKRLNFWVVGVALAILGVVTFTLCLLWDLVLPAFSMVPVWKAVLPGFQGVTWGSYFLGLGEIVLYALYAAGIFVPTHNWLTRFNGQRPTKGAMNHV